MPPAPAAPSAPTLSPDQWVQIFSIATSLASLVLAVFAIWLSWEFYKASVASAAQTTEAAKAIESGVQRVEKLFEYMYSDTFSIMKETYSDMRQQAFRPMVGPHENAAAVAEVDNKVEAIRTELRTELRQIANRSSAASPSSNAKPAQIEGELSALLDEAISRTRKASADSMAKTTVEQKKGSLISLLAGMRESPIQSTVGGTTSYGPAKYRATALQAIEELSGEGLIELSDGLASDSKITITEKGVRRFVNQTLKG